MEKFLKNVGFNDIVKQFLYSYTLKRFKIMISYIANKLIFQFLFQINFPKKNNFWSK